jgi:hypothetical protein
VNLLRYLFPIAFSWNYRGNSLSFFRDGLAQCSLGTFGISATGWLAITAAAGTAASSINSANASRKSINAQKDALNAQKDIAANLKYEPIDIKNLTEQARQQAVSNAVNSLAMERELSPDVAASRQMVAQRVSQDLALGGQLSPDVANQVARASRTQGARSGAPAGPITAAQIGLTGEQLRNSRLAEGMQFLNQNKLPVSGLDPGALASLTVSQNNALNQFNAAKAGVDANLAQSTGQVNAGLAAQEGAQNQAWINGFTSLAGTMGSFGGNNIPSSGLSLGQQPSFLGNAKPFDMGGLPIGNVMPTPFNYSMNPTT